MRETRNHEPASGKLVPRHALGSSISRRQLDGLRPPLRSWHLESPTVEPSLPPEAGAVAIPRNGDAVRRLLTRRSEALAETRQHPYHATAKSNQHPKPNPLRQPVSGSRLVFDTPST